MQDTVRQAKGLVTRRYALRPVPQSLPRSHRPCGNRHVLAMNPDPSLPQ